jgi:Ser/Thr protein kinase RdoA (MazF antagonist)
LTENPDTLAKIGDILAKFYGINSVDISVIDSGRVHWTYLVTIGGQNSYVFQRLNSFFGSSEALGDNLNRINMALTNAPVGSPKIVPTLDGQWLYVDEADQSSYRLTCFLPGRHPEKESVSDAKLAGQAVGYCHVSLNRPKPIELFHFDDIDGECTNHRLCRASDFAAIKTRYRGHPHLPSVLPDLDRGAKAANCLPTRPSFMRVFMARDLVVHRDCKRNNFLINGDKVGLIDWDTVGYGDPLLDIGEMCRSWCVGSEKPFFNATVAAALVEGYRSTGLSLTLEQYQMIPAVVRGLAINLARRYLTDSLAEVFFRWDKELYKSLHEQNHIRGQLYLNLAEELLDREIELLSIF